MSALMSPDCRDGDKHKACAGDGWCEESDRAVPCPCECHQPKECYPGCPHPPCVAIRAARPVTHAIQAKHLSGASIGKQVQYSDSRSLTTNEHIWSPPGQLVNVWHAENSVEIAIDWGEGAYDQTGLKPDNWVRVTTPVPATAGQLSGLQPSPSTSSAWQDPGTPHAGSNP